MIDIWIYLSNGCNLRCAYCYQDDTIREKKEDYKMSPETGRMIIDWTISEAKRQQQIVNLYFYGGEPLTNIPTIKEIIQYSHEKSKDPSIDYKYYVVTNGTLFTKDILNFFEKYQVGFQLSIDGKPDSHDKFRYFSNKKGSYSKIGGSVGFDQLLSSKQCKNINMVYSPETVENLFDNFYHLISLKPRSVQLSPALEDTLNWKDQQKVFKKEFKKITDYFYNEIFINNTYVYINPINHILTYMYIGSIEELKNRIISHTKCHAGVASFSVDVYGFIYTCSRLPDDTSYKSEDFRIGNVYKGIYNYDLYNGLRTWSPNTNDKSKCSSCDYNIMCYYQCFGLNLCNSNDPYIVSENCCIIAETQIEILKEIYIKLMKEHKDKFIDYLKKNSSLIRKYLNEQYV